MQLTKQDISDFQQIYLQQFGIKLNEKEAEEQAYFCLVLAKYELQPAEVRNEK